MASIDDLLIQYFFSWRSYKQILARLHYVHGITRSLKWIKNQYKRLGLRRRGVTPSLNVIRPLIRELLKSSDGLRGYRAIWKILCDKYHISVKRAIVMKLVKEIDPVGVQNRRRRRLRRRVYLSKGPNYLWHIDGYDKLSPYGLTIHGCIDGYSRRILWLEITMTNHNPAVILHHYLKAVAVIGGCPRVLRSDYRTENGELARVQMAFRLDHSDSLAGGKSFMYGPSTRNTRIESWWAQLGRFKTEWWIQLCKGLVLDGCFDVNNTFQRYSLAYTLVPLLQEDLNDFVQHWNTHSIRPSPYAVCPGGIPDDLFQMPEYFGAEDYLKSFDDDVWVHAWVERAEPPPEFVPTDFKQWADAAMDVMGISRNHITFTNCRNIYLRLLDYLHFCGLQ